MKQHTALTTETRLPGLQSLLDTTRISEGAGTTGGNSKYEPSNSQLYSNGFRESTANTQSTSEPRSTVQLPRPGQPMPIILPTPIGSMPSPGGSSLVNISQVMNSPLPAIDNLRQRSRLEQRLASSAKPSCQYDSLKRIRLQSMASQPAIGATRGSPVPASTAVTSHSQPFMASPKAHVHPPPTTTLSPQNVQWIQDSPTHHQGMQPYLGSPPSENAAPLRHKNVHVGDMRARYFGVDEGPSYIALPESEQVLSVPVDLTRASKDADKRRERNADASRKHRKTLKELREEKKKWEQDMKELEEDRNFYRDIVKRTPSLSHFVRPLKVLSQTSNTAATKHQGSPDEQQSKRRRTS